MSRALNALNTSWGWSGVRFAEIVAHSLMGHMLVTDTDGGFHYVDPELGSVTALGDEAGASAYMARRETQVVWRADALVDAANARLGPPGASEVYSLALPAIVAGDYAHENLIRIDFVEMIHLTGDLARQTRDLPEGAPITLKVD